eukprot:764709-Amphidinium_carterae.1
MEARKEREPLRVHPQLGVYTVTTRELNEETIEYVTYLPGDAPDDERRRQQIHYLEDDIESIVDEEYYRARKQGEQGLSDEQYKMPNARLDQRERERHVRRKQRKKARLPERYTANKEDLRKMRDALIAITVSGRRQRLKELSKTRPTSSVPVPKAPPFGAIQVSSTLEIERRVNGMSLQELQDQ